MELCMSCGYKKCKQAGMIECSDWAQEIFLVCLHSQTIAFTKIADAWRFLKDNDLPKVNVQSIPLHAKPKNSL